MGPCNNIVYKDRCNYVVYGLLGGYNKHSSGKRSGEIQHQQWERKKHITFGESMLILIFKKKKHIEN